MIESRGSSEEGEQRYKDNRSEEIKENKQDVQIPSRKPFSFSVGFFGGKEEGGKRKPNLQSKPTIHNS